MRVSTHKLLALVVAGSLAVADGGRPDSDLPPESRGPGGSTAAEGCP
jgi:hypothetical protein